jgi:hypothetical protein
MERTHMHAMEEGTANVNAMTLNITRPVQQVDDGPRSEAAA